MLNSYYIMKVKDNFEERYNNKKKRGTKWDCHWFLSCKKIVRRFVQRHVFAQSPPEGATVINNQSKLRTAPDFGTKFSLVVLFCNEANSCPVSTQTCIYKGKTISLQAWPGLEGSRRLRLPDFKTIGT